MEPVPRAQGAPRGGEHHLTSRATSTLVVTAGGHALSHAAKVALPFATLSVTAADFGVGRAEMSLALSLFLLGMGLSSVPAGLLGDRLGMARVLTWFFWAFAFASAACALAETYTAFLVAHAALGLATGLFHPAGLGLISHAVEPARLGHAMGLFGVGGSVGLAVMPLAMGSALGWRAGFYCLATAGFVGAFAWHRLQSTGRVPMGPAAAHEGGAEEHGLPRLDLVLLLLAMSVSAFMLGGFEPLFPETVRARSSPVMDDWAVNTLIVGLGALGQYVGGMLARDPHTASRFALLLLLQPLILLGLAASLPRELLPHALLTGFLFLNYATMPMENKLLASYTRSRRRATAYALKFLVVLVVAAPAPSLVAEMLKTDGSGAMAYRALALIGMVGVFAGAFFLRATRRLADRRRAATRAG